MPLSRQIVSNRLKCCTNSCKNFHVSAISILKSKIGKSLYSILYKTIDAKTNYIN